MIENNNSLNFGDNEIIDNRSHNSFKKVSMRQSKEKLSKTDFSQIFHYIFYFSVIILIYALFFVNYLKTNKWYEENTHYINLNPFSICDNYIKGFEKCLNKSIKSINMLKKEGDKYTYVNDTNTICKEYNDLLQICIDDVHIFSTKCQRHLNELYLCKNKGKELKKCLNNNFLSCSKVFNIINVSKVFDDL